MTRRPHGRPRSTVRGVLVVLATVVVLAPLVLPAGTPAVGAPATGRPGPRPAPTLVLTTGSLVAVGEDLVATAVSRPARPGTAVRLQVRRGAGWATVARARQDRRGAVTLRLARPAEGLLAVRAVRGRDRPVSSAAVPVRVAPTEEVLPAVPGQLPDRGAQDVDVSDDSRILAYTVRVAGPAGNPPVRIAVHDRLTRRTSMLPLPVGSPAQSIPTVSPNGRYVAYVSVLPRDGGGSRDQVFLTDLTTNRTVTIPGPTEVTGLDVSSDGRFLAITSSAWPNAGLCGRDPSQGGEREGDAYLLDRRTGRLTCLSSGLDGRVQGRVGPPTLSRDASVVLFGFGFRTSFNGDFDGELYRWEAGRRTLVRTPTDRVLDHTDRGSTLLVDVPRADGPPDDLGLYDVARGTIRNLTPYDDAGSYAGWISADGSYLWFLSQATDLGERPAPIGPNPRCAYRRQVTTGATVVAFCGTDGEPVAASDDGRFFAAVDARNLVVTHFLPR